jgi:hypothetical protein
VLAAAGAGALPLLGSRAVAAEEKPMLMFVQVAASMAVEEAAGKLRLIGLSPQTLYFADRPERIAGHIKMDAFMEEWTAKAGADNFGKDPPNAALSVYEPDQPDSTVAIIEIMHPRIEGGDLEYAFKRIDGQLPKFGGETALFIDWIGVGGGVGPGFHGVGVGLRGPGLR